MSETEQIVKVIRLYEDARSDGSEWNQHYDDIARVMRPRRIGFSTTVIEGDRRTDELYDSTPLQGARSLANAIASILRPKGGLPDFEIEAEEDDLNNQDEHKEWFSDSKKRLEGALANPKSQYIGSCGELEADLVTLGTGVLFNGESKRRDHLLFRCINLKDSAFAFDEEGTPSTYFEKRRMAVHQVAGQFGRNRLSDRTLELLKNKPFEKVDILHAVMPREHGQSNVLLARNLPFSDLWIEMDEKRILTDGGFHEFPFVIPRWDTASGESRGRSPGMIALPDADTLQAMGETILIAGQRAADPPLATPNDGTFNPVNTFPGGLAYYDVETAASVGGNPFFPITSGMNLPITRDMQQDTREQVFAAFYRNVLNLPIEGPQMTATETIQRKQEMIREVGPVFGRRDSDYLGPKIERSFMVMLRAGGFRPIPENLQGENIRFSYSSVIKRIAQQIDAAASKKWAAEQIELSNATGRQEPIDLINFDALGRMDADAAGVPKEIVNGEDTVKAMREARAQAQAEQQQTEELAQGVEIAKMGAEAIEKGVRAGDTGQAEPQQPTR